MMQHCLKDWDGSTNKQGLDSYLCVQSYGIKVGYGAGGGGSTVRPGDQQAAPKSSSCC